MWLVTGQCPQLSASKSAPNFSSRNRKEWGISRLQIQKEFTQLGHDLQSGNLSNAQSDFTSSQSLLQNGGSSSTSSPSTCTGVSITA